MPDDRHGWSRVIAVVALAALTLGTGLGGSSRLSYHEAIVAQGAREMLARGDWLIPTLAGLPWLEKPPLAHWLVAATATATGRLDEAAARLPSALAATLLCLGVSSLVARRLGPNMALLAGGVQATTLWTVTRGRLAEADILLACLVTWTLVVFDRLRSTPVCPFEDLPRPGGRPILGVSVPNPDTPILGLPPEATDPAGRSSTEVGVRGPRAARGLVLAFFALLGATSLAKGLGFGAALVAATVALVLLWDRDTKTSRSLLSPTGWTLAAILALAWPASVISHHPAALSLWTTHLTDRLASQPRQFASEPWWQYALSPLSQTLPWTPLALLALRDSWRRARAEPLGLDRLLWAWAVVPTALLSLASVRNAHYLIHALPPWSIWAALALRRLDDRLHGRARRPTLAAFVALGLAYALGFAALGPRFDRRGVEWSWYATAVRSLRPDERLVLLYDDWDRAPYTTPFGPVPHDLAVRLFYLDRPTTWRLGLDGRPDLSPSFALLGRARDLPELRRLGRVAVVSRGPATRWDRTYTLFRVERDAAHLALLPRKAATTLTPPTSPPANRRYSSDSTPYSANRP